MKYLYSWPALAAATSADHSPEDPSFTSGFDVVLQPLKTPGTDTELAFGAQTRNVTPVPFGPAYGIAPIPGLADCPHVGVTPKPKQQSIPKQILTFHFFFTWMD
jgi:hypothetical protein